MGRTISKTPSVLRRTVSPHIPPASCSSGARWTRDREVMVPHSTEHCSGRGDATVGALAGSLAIEPHDHIPEGEGGGGEFRSRQRHNTAHRPCARSCGVSLGTFLKGFSLGSRPSPPHDALPCRQSHVDPPHPLAVTYARAHERPGHGSHCWAPLDDPPAHDWTCFPPSASDPLAKPGPGDLSERFGACAFALANAGEPSSSGIRTSNHWCRRHVLYPVHRWESRYPLAGPPSVPNPSVRISCLEGTARVSLFWSVQDGRMLVTVHPVALP